MSHITHILPFPTADLPEQQDKLSAEFPGWEISFMVLIDGHTWAMPRGVRWTAVSGDVKVTASSADDLRKKLGSVTPGTARSLTWVRVKCSPGIACNVARLPVAS